MTTLALSPRRPWGPRLIRAEILKLATRRGLMAAASCLTIGATVATFAILAVLHLTDPAHHKLIGGLSHFDNGIYSLTQLATIAAVLIGATAGAGDLAGGFFRNLVVTGRPRWQLYAARIPGGLTLLLPITALAYAILAALSQVVPGGQGTPSTVLNLWQLAPKELQNGAPPGHLAMSLPATVTALVTWMLLAIGLGAWRTITRDA